MTSRKFAIVLAVVSALVLLAAAVPTLDDAFRPTAANARAQQAGNYASLSDGVTHYELLGPPDGAPVVLIHGVSGPMKVWDRLVPALTAQGYRVLRYDLFGRGLSDRIDGNYDAALFERQLTELIAEARYAGFAGPVTLVGSSMGAIIATGFANTHRNDVRAVVLVGPAGFPIVASPAAKVLDVPLLGPALMALAGGKLLPEHHRKYFVHPDAVPEMHAAFAAQLRLRGTKRAIRNTMAFMPVTDFRSGYQRLGVSAIPVQLLWGEGDVTFRFSNHGTLQRLVPQAQFTAIPGAAHLPSYEAANVTLAALLPFLNRVSEKTAGLAGNGDGTRGR